LKFPTIVEKTAKQILGGYFFAAPCRWNRRWNATKQWAEFNFWIWFLL